MEWFQSEKLAEQVTRILCTGDVYAYLVEGETSAALIDTGFGVGSLKAYVETLTDLPYIVLLTHGHLDHAGGAGEFAQVYLNENDLELAKEHTSIEKRSPRFLGGEHPISLSDLVPPKPIAEYLPLTHEQSFDLGGITVTMLKLVGHTPGSMCVLVEELRAVLLGDACNSLGYLQLPESLSVAEYGNAMKTFTRYKDRFDTVWFSHPHNFGGKEILDETIKLCDEIVSGQRKGVPYGVYEDGRNLLVAKELDAYEHARDGKAANFIFCQENIL